MENSPLELRKEARIVRVFAAFNLGAGSFTEFIAVAGLAANNPRPGITGAAAGLGAFCLAHSANGALKSVGIDNRANALEVSQQNQASPQDQ